MKKTKRVLSVLLAVLLLASSLPMTAWAAQDIAQAISEKYGGGDGTADSPYLISSAEHLKTLSETKEDWKSHFKQTEDIDLSTVCGEELNDGTNWTPIGDSISHFFGTFDGDNHKITGLYIHAENKDYCGLFGCIGKNAVVQNLSVYGSVTGNSDVGGIAGWNNDYGTITNCHSFVNVSGGRGSVGGIAGTIGNYSKVTNCSNSGDIFGKELSVGGIVGSSFRDYSAVQNCRNTGNVTGKDYVGGVVGYNHSVIAITDCSNTGKVSCYESSDDFSSLGGVVGTNDGTVKNSYNTGEVSAFIPGNGVISTGGVVGDNSGTVTNCYNTGSVTGDAEVGGVVGDDYGTIKDCYNTGSVTGYIAANNNPLSVGGVVGESGSVLENCYSIGTVSAPEGNRVYVGGVAGGNHGHAKNCYYLKGAATAGIGNPGNSDIPGLAERLTSGEFKLETSFRNWDFTGIWEMGKNAEGQPIRPILVSHKEENLQWLVKCGCHEDCGCEKDECECEDCPGNGNIYTSDSRYAGGIGSSADPYLIETAAQLKALADAVNGGSAYEKVHFKLTRDIDLSEIGVSESGGTSWTPIGYYNSRNSTPDSKPFSGTFDGDGHKITGLYVELYGRDNQGLFGYVDGGTIKNLGVVGAVFGYSSAGGIAASVHGTVENCYYIGKLSGRSHTGGIAGFLSGTVRNCYHIGPVTSTLNVGGIVGWTIGGTVENCYNTGTVTGSSDSIGGVVGSLVSGEVKNCYNTGTVKYTGSSDVDFGKEIGIGGVVGKNDYDTKESPHGIVENCYYLEGTAEKGVGHSFGTAAAIDVEAFADEETFENWDFTDIWEMGTDKEGNPIRPVLTANKEENLKSLLKCGCHEDCSCPDNCECEEGSCDCTDCPGKTPEPPKCGCKDCDSTKCTCTGNCSGNPCSCAGCSGKPDDSGSGGNQGGSSGGDNGGGNQGGNSGGDTGGNGGSGDDGSGGNGSGDDTPSDIHFVDVPSGEYYYDAVYWAAGKEIVAGTSATTFSPNATCTRAQIVTFLWRANGSPEPTIGYNPFMDVNPKEYYYKAVLWAYKEGIVSGTSATTFSPNASCTRAQTVTFLYRANGSPKASGGGKFTDVPSNAYYANAVSWATSNGIVYGTSADKFSPGNTCTRAQSVTFLYRNLAE